MTKFFEDNFDRADSATVGNGWTEGNAALSEILGNKLRFSGGGSFSTNVCYAPVAADFQNGSAIVDFQILGSGAVPQIHVRYNSGTASSYVFFWIAGDLRLASNNAGSLSTLDNIAQALSVGVNYRFTFAINGNSKVCTLRNVDTATDLQTLTDSVNADHTASGSVGLSISSGDGADYDNFISGISSVVTDPLKNYSGTTLANETGYIANFYSKTDGTLIDRVSGVSTGAGGIADISSSLIADGTSYRVDIEDDLGTSFGNKEYTAAI